MGLPRSCETMQTVLTAQCIDHMSGDLHPGHAILISLLTVNLVWMMYTIKRGRGDSKHRIQRFTVNHKSDT